MIHGDHFLVIDSVNLTNVLLLLYVINTYECPNVIVIVVKY